MHHASALRLPAGLSSLPARPTAAVWCVLSVITWTGPAGSFSVRILGPLRVRAARLDTGCRLVNPRQKLHGGHDVRVVWREGCELVPEEILKLFLGHGQCTFLDMHIGDICTNAERELMEGT